MKKMPKVLLLGDSIRMSYQPLVTEKLKDCAVVVGPEDNCQFSSYTLSSIDRWVDSLGVPDIVHWNNGIHDAGHNPARTPIQIPLEEYKTNLGLILKKLKSMTPNIIWATSTPVHPNRPFRDDQWSWRNSEIDQYNAVASEIMKSQGIPINDLHSVVASDYNLYLADDQLHLSEAGVRKCAEAVADVIRKFIKSI